MPFRIFYKERARKDLKKIPPKWRQKLVEAIESLKIDPFRGKKLQGELEGIYSLRVWPYRILYQVLKKEVSIFVLHTVTKAKKARFFNYDNAFCMKKRNTFLSILLIFFILIPSGAFAKQIQAPPKSPGVFFPYSDRVTINNLHPTIIGKIEQTETFFLKTKYVLEKDPVSVDESYFLRFIPGRVKNIHFYLDDKKVTEVYGFAQYPTIRCKKLRTEELTPEAQCIEENKDEFPPVIFFFKPKKPLSSGKHVFRAEEKSTIFTIDPTLKLEPANITNPPPLDPLNYPDFIQPFDEMDNCASGYYYDERYLPVPLPRLVTDKSLLYQIYFPQSEKEYGKISPRRKAYIVIAEKRFELFFPASKIFFDGKSFLVEELLTMNEKTSLENLIPPGEGLFLPMNNVVFRNRKKVQVFKEIMNPQANLYHEYFELVPIDYSGRGYAKNILPWMTVSDSGCDG